MEATKTSRKDYKCNNFEIEQSLNLQNGTAVAQNENLQTGDEKPQKHGKYHMALQLLLPYRCTKGRTNILPLSKIGFFNFITSNWMTKFLWKAYRKKFTLSAIPAVDEQDSAYINSLRLERLWEKELKQRGPENASFMRVILYFQRTRLLVTMLTTVLLIVFLFLGPAFLVRLIVEYLEGRLEKPLWYGIVLVLGLMMSQLLQNASSSVGGNIAMITGMRVKGAIMDLILRKILRSRSLADKSVGQIVNICVQDSAIVYRSVQMFTYAIVTPVQVVVTIVYTCYILGPWALLGCFVIITFYPLQAIFAKFIIQLTQSGTKLTDLRVNLMNNILNNIKLIKMNAWEESFTKVIGDLRDKELNKITLRNIIFGISGTIGPLVPIFAYSLTIIGYTLSGNNLLPSEAFSVVAIFNSNIFSLALLSWVLEAISQTTVSCQRIKGVMLLEEMEPILPVDSKSEAIISINNATMAFLRILPKDEKSKEKKKDKKNELQELTTPEKKPEKYVNILHDINLQVFKNQLIGICGSVGSGKSCLLSGILREMKIMKGSLYVSGTIGYVPQQASIFNTTLRENILFGLPYHEERYQEAIFASCLNSDLEELADGDWTEIGEKGVNLSGGQRQRVSLARAIYNNSNIYLLDDPLSAVDPTVGRHIYTHAILGVLKRKTVILVSHQLQYLKECDLIIFLKEGHIYESGTYNQLMESDGEFAYLYKKHIGEEETNTNSKENKEIEKNDSKVKMEDTEKLIQDEDKEYGGLKWAVVSSYLKSSGNCCFIFTVFLTLIIYQGSTVFNSFWLGVWLKDGSGQNINVTYQSINSSIDGYSDDVILDNNNNDNNTIWNFEFEKDVNLNLDITQNPKLHFYILIFAMSLTAISIFGVLKNYFFMKSAANSSNSLHASMFKQILRCPVSFFDTNPLGRILNRFSSDLGLVDIFLPMMIGSFYGNTLVCLGAAMQIAIVEPIILAPFTVFVIIVIVIENFFRIAINDLKRLESMSASPVISQVTSIIGGLSTIRAFKQEQQFLDQFHKFVDSSLVMNALYFFGTRWYGWRLSLLIILVMLMAGLALILSGTNGAMAGVALSASLQITLYFQHLMQSKSMAESSFTSVERIHQYIKKLPSEAELIIPSARPNSFWPQKGKIVFNDVQLRYRKKLQLVLKNVSFSINPCEKIGIVGRSGAGKSTIGVALFRMTELVGGKILIDGVDISKLGLHDVRSKLSIIPQEPQLFSGTLRYNLDPFNKHTDDALWSALEKTHLKLKIQAENKQLETAVDNSGENFSIGERQLLCLARSLLRNSKILILDEATASVDTETDYFIQETIKTEFRHSTVLTIAHRLNTILSSDKIIVMQAGEVKEFDTPAVLLANKESIFHSMALEAGLLTADSSQNHIAKANS